jgi:hypothetical protein
VPLTGGGRTSEKVHARRAQISEGDRAIKASDLFVRCLEVEGIEYIFGVPGEENADFMISLEQSETIKFILTRHEQGAAFMAEVYGRLTGIPLDVWAPWGRGLPISSPV